MKYTMLPPLLLSISLWFAHAAPTASAATLTLPTVTVTHLDHMFQWLDWNPNATLARDVATAAPASFAAAFADYEGVSATLRAPAGYKFVVTPAPSDNFTTTLEYRMQWGFSTGGPAPLVDQTVAFEGLVGTSPTLSSSSTYLDQTGNLLIVGGEFAVTMSFEFTAMTTTFRFGNAMPQGMDDLSLRTSEVLQGVARSPWVSQDVSVLSLVAVPEPSAMAVVVGVVGALGVRRRRQR